MRKELLIKRNKLSKEIEEMNITIKECDKKQSFKLGLLMQEKKKQYEFISNLLKVI